MINHRIGEIDLDLMVEQNRDPGCWLLQSKTSTAVATFRVDNIS